jgi:hypothetical protein
MALVWLPERQSRYPVPFLEDTFGEAEGLKHFHGTAGDTICLPELKRARLLIEDQSF